ncbi:hypothetical protein BAE44_0023551, partial [Dichanthelium oligosanthes]
LLEEGNIMVGPFRLSLNYFTLKPGQVYVFDEKKAYIHPMSNLVASHAVMMVGTRHCWIAPKRFLWYIVMQNSLGEAVLDRWHRQGVAKNTIQGLYRLEVKIPKEVFLDS